MRERIENLGLAAKIVWSDDNVLLRPILVYVQFTNCIAIYKKSGVRVGCKSYMYFLVPFSYTGAVPMLRKVEVLECQGPFYFVLNRFIAFVGWTIISLANAGAFSI